MEKSRFWVTFTIDCEATQVYVDDPEMGKISDRGFRDVLEKYGMKGTFLSFPVMLSRTASSIVSFRSAGTRLVCIFTPLMRVILSSRESWDRKNSVK